VCLEADKTASRGKTKAEICGENRRKRRKIRIGGNINQESGVFPQPVKAHSSHATYTGDKSPAYHPEEFLRSL
jgi:hypothetical protein